jgi:hypothetical protein
MPFQASEYEKSASVKAFDAQIESFSRGHTAGLPDERWLAEPAGHDLSHPEDERLSVRGDAARVGLGNGGSWRLTHR